MTTKDKATKIIKKRYNRFAPLYDFLEGIIERPDFSRWRELLWSKVTDAHILEVDVGTGKNFLYYPPDDKVTAIDLSEGMLERAQIKASKQKVKVRLEQMDVQNLPDFAVAQQLLPVHGLPGPFTAGRQRIRDLRTQFRVTRILRDLQHHNPL